MIIVDLSKCFRGPSTAKKIMDTDYVDRLQVMCQESENRNFVNSGQSLHHFVLHAHCGKMVRC